MTPLFRVRSCYFVSDPPDLQTSLTMPDGVMTSVQSSVVSALVPSVMVQGWRGAVSPAIPPSVSPTHFVAFVGFAFVVPEHTTDAMPDAETDILTEVGVNVVSAAKQVLSSTAHVPVAAVPGAVCANAPAG